MQIIITAWMRQFHASVKTLVPNIETNKQPDYWATAQYLFNSGQSPETAAATVAARYLDEGKSDKKV